jgi:translation initiation factor 3 subunit F
MDLVPVAGVTGQTLQVHASPTVILEILEQFFLKKPGQERVIGALLGEVNVLDDEHSTSAGTDAAVRRQIEVWGSFYVPHSETDTEIALDIDYFGQMRALSLQDGSTGPTVDIIGWYTTGGIDKPTSIIIHEFFARQCNLPVDQVVCLLVRPDIRESNASKRVVHPPLIQAYSGFASVLGRQNMSTDLEPVPLEVTASDAEQLMLNGVVQALAAQSNVHSRFGRITRATALGGATHELVNLTRSLRKLVDALDTVLEYLRDVVSGEKAGDPAVLELLNLVEAELNACGDEALMHALDTNLKDQLMTLYLSRLTSANLVLGERLLTLEK